MLRRLFLGLLPAARGSWVGKKVMPKKVGVTITGGPNRLVYVATLSRILYTVEKEEGGLVSVRDGAVVGWLDKSDAVLLEDAVRYFTGRIRRDEKDAYAYALRGWAWKEMGEHDKAVKDYDEAIRLEPETAVWLSNRGFIWSEKKEYDRAIADYSEAIRLDPEDAPSYRNRGNAWFAKKEYDRAIADHGEAIRLNPRDVLAFNSRGLAWDAKKDHAKAIADFDEAIRLDPKNAWAFIARGVSWAAKEGYAKAIADYGEAIRLNPNDPAAYNQLAWLWATCADGKFRDGRRAVESATRACELTGWKDPSSIDTLAVAYAEAGDFEQALRWAERALEAPGLDKEGEKEVRLHLELFQEGKPYHQASGCAAAQDSRSSPRPAEG